MSDLRKACEELLADLTVLSDFDIVLPKNINRLESFVKRQRNEAVNEHIKQQECERSQS